MKTRSEKIQELIKLANTSDKDLAKMNYKEKQKVFKAKSQLCNKVWDSSNGTYIKPKQELKQRVIKNKNEYYG